MIEEILPNLYRIEIPLPGSPLKALNSYLIKAPGRSLLIDTGMNREECMGAMSASLARLDVDLEKTDFFITHLHADHSGLVSNLATSASTIYFNQKEADIVNSERAESRWQQIYTVFLSNGFPQDELKASMESHPGRRYRAQRRLDFCTLKEADRIEIGDYSFRCIETPGHSPGHTCLYEESKKILVAGDHILFDITPNIAYWLNMVNPLGQYLMSLDKVYSLNVNLILPGHRSLMSDHRKRIRELRAHHQARLNEVLSALEDGEKTAFQVAPYITWDIDCASWEVFPAQQKWFAFGETLAHLHYLEENKVVKKTIRDHKVVFSRV